MSDVPPDLARPAPPPTWRDHVAAFAESLDLSPRRLVVGAAVLVVAGLLAWRMLAPPAGAPEMDLPFAEPAADPANAAAGGDGGPGGPGAGAAAGVGAAGGPGSADPAAAGAASGEVVVHVAGAVGEPGVQRLPAGSRVVDAVEAAGGAVPDADPGRVNLAAPLQDGQQVYLPKVGEAPPAAPAGAPGDAGGTSGPSPPGAAGPPINVNTASAAELEALPGVGPATAEAIVAHRDQNGPFTSVDQLIDVRGIGEVKLAQLRDHVTV